MNVCMHVACVCVLELRTFFLLFVHGMHRTVTSQLLVDEELLQTDTMLFGTKGCLDVLCWRRLPKSTQEGAGDRRR